MKKESRIGRAAIAIALTLPVVLAVSVSAFCQVDARREIRIPDIPGYVTLKCDFHMHSIFSDGDVWPTVRAEEAWREGLDVFSITDHIEYKPHEPDVVKDHNRAYEIVRARAKELGLIVVRGAEITRRMPPGHFNAIFLKDANLLDTEEYKDAINAAVKQGAFVIWNHPGWRQPGEVPIWYEEHTELYENGWMNGMEVVNEDSYYPLAHKWCLEKKITMLGNSDVHGPVGMFWDLAAGEHRPVTLIFAEEASAEAVKEALLARRTAVWWRDKLIGEEQYLRPIFDESIEIINPKAPVGNERWVYAQLRNNSDIPFEMVRVDPEDTSAPEKITLPANRTVLFRIDVKSLQEERDGEFAFRYFVKNLLVAPDAGLLVELRFQIKFSNSGKNNLDEDK